MPLTEGNPATRQLLSGATSLLPRGSRHVTLQTPNCEIGIIRRCPLWVKSRHVRRKKAMSALPPIADIQAEKQRSSFTRFTPEHERQAAGDDEAGCAPPNWNLKPAYDDLP